METYQTEFCGSFDSPGRLPAEGLPEIAFVGRSNVGKSSLINMLLGRRAVARTSSRPGKTRTLNLYLVEGVRYFVDLPGLGYAKVSKSERAAWRRLITAYLAERGSLRLVVQLIDARHGITPVDEEIFEVVGRAEAPRVLAMTKSDKLSRSRLPTVVARLKQELLTRGLEIPIVATSATRKEGRRELWKWVEDLT